MYIYGGAFVGGSAAEFPPWLMVDHFVARDIVLAIPNYRVNQLSTWWVESEGTLGNYFVYDHITALRWIRRDISAFGGDREEVTIGGCSSGAISASLLTLTHKADGLFKRSIHQSGSAVSPAYVHTDPELRGTNARDLSLKVGCIQTEEEWDTVDPEEIARCMRDVPVTILLEKQLDMLQRESAPDLRISDGPNGLFKGKDLERLTSERLPRAQLSELTKREWGSFFALPLKLLNISAEMVQHQLIPAACAAVAPSFGIKEPSELLIKSCAAFYSQQSRPYEI